MSELFLAYSVESGTRPERWPTALEQALRVYEGRFGCAPGVVLVRPGTPEFAAGVPVRELATVPAGLLYLVCPADAPAQVDELVEPGALRQLALF